MSLVSLVVLPVGLGLLGFIEPCSMGSSLVFIKFLEGKDAATKTTQLGMFTVTRALFIGTLGGLSVPLGMAFLGFQRVAWLVLGALYLVIGTFYLVGKAGILTGTIGPRMSRISGTQGSAALGVLFGLNIPACVAPLLPVLLGTTAASGGRTGSLASGFVSLGLFGLALSLPLALAIVFEPARRALDWLGGLSRRIPFWTGVVLILLGFWSIGFGLFVSLEKWT